MKYRHYAPVTPLTVLRGTLPEQVSLVREQAQLCRIGILAFDDDAAAFSPLPTITYGAKHDDTAQAQQLFTALHEVDQLGVERVFVQVSTQEHGLFLAVRNRLLKAAGYKVAG
jgi:L-threonylcarbamoyladenylate synthase